ARFGSVERDSSHYLFLAYRVQWESESIVEEFDFIVFEQDTLLAAEVTGFRARLWSWLVAIVLVLILLQFLVMRWGLNPIAIFTKDIDAIAQGRAQSLVGDYPDELKPLAQTLNRLIDQEQAQRERYRLTLADLAHSLKTPLSIVRNSLTALKADTALQQSAAEIDAQVEQMDQLVAYQLERAVLASSPLVKTEIQSQVLLDGLIDALQKVYIAKNVQLEANVEADVCFADARDLQQMWGNLLDNAFKYCDGKVAVRLLRREGQLILQVEDDGPGIVEAMRNQVLARGFRLDTQAQGQGIGLAVVIEIAARYEGTLAIDQADRLGGARFELTLAVA
ncbi:MAG: ATP-binding protein, partial [Pseudomonadales bacterium]